MSGIKITSVKLVKEGEKLEVSYRESDKLQQNVDLKIDNVVHPDLVKAMDKLIPHLAVLTNQIEQEGYLKNPELKNFRVNGYHIGGKEGQDGINIVGGLSGDYGYVGLNAPFLRLEGYTPENKYINLENLKSAVKLIEEETLLFMNGDKMAQPGMFPEEGNKATKLKIAKSDEDPNDKVETGKGKPQTAKNKAGKRK